jgi:hypothetical protein
MDAANTVDSGKMEVIPDGAIVTRGGRNRPEDIEKGMGTHPSGVNGVSVESRDGKSVEELAANIPHTQIGVTTVGKVRAAGGDVVPTSGRSPNHATLTGLSPKQISDLLTPTKPNPSRKA